MSSTVLVAGIGNIFLSDDGFGPAVLRLLTEPEQAVPPGGARLTDYGIRGLHLLYDLLDGYEALVIIDALPGRGVAGEIVVLQVAAADLDQLGSNVDPHGMDPVAVLSGLPALGGELPPTYVVGAAPESLEEGIGLTPTLAAAVPQAAATVRALLAARPWRSSPAVVAASGRG